MSKKCLIYNFAPHYRTNIFSLLDKNLDLDFYFGDDMGDVKKMDYSLLNQPVHEVHNSKIGPFEWQSGVIKLAFKPYQKYIILAGPLVLSTWLFTLFARLQGKKVYFWSHGWYGKESRIQRLLKLIFFRLPTKTFLYGNYARNLMIKAGFRDKSLVTIHNSLMYDKQLAIRKSLHVTTVYSEHFKNDLPTVIFVGRLTPVKQLHLLLESLAINLNRNVHYNVTFIGNGSEKQSLENLSEKLHLSDHVWFYGPTYDEQELSNLIYNADLCVAPGNIGLTAMHAMVYGCPCLSHNDFKWQMPEFEAIVDGVTGTFYKKNSVDSLADSISTWLKNKSCKRAQVRDSCFSEIDNNWNPHKQLDIIVKNLNE